MKMHERRDSLSGTSAQCKLLTNSPNLTIGWGWFFLDPLLFHFTAVSVVKEENINCKSRLYLHFSSADISGFKVVCSIWLNRTMAQICSKQHDVSFSFSGFNFIVNYSIIPGNVDNLMNVVLSAYMLCYGDVSS